MIINLSPVRDDRELSVAVSGDVLTVNGIDYDFTPLAEEDALPAEATGCDLLFGEVTRRAGEIVLTLLLPHGAEASEAARFPKPLHITKNGKVELPQ